MTKGTYSAALVAFNEIRQILKKHELGGAIHIVSKDRAGWRYFWPPWTAIYERADGAVGIRLRSKEFKSIKGARHPAERHLAEHTAHTVFQLRDLAAQQFAAMDKLCDEIEKHWEVEHHPGRDRQPE